MTIPPVPSASDPDSTTPGTGATPEPGRPATDPYAAPEAPPAAPQQPGAYGQQSYGQQQPYGQAAAQPGQQPYYGAQPYQQNYAPAPPKTLSIIAMIGGIAGLTILPFLGSIAGVILGHMGLKREPAGRGFALAGLITGYIGLALSVLGIILIIIWFVVFAAAIGSAGYDYSDFSLSASTLL